MLVPGFTFLGRNLHYPTEHFNIIISPNICGKILYVNITTKKESSDTTCIIKKGDHPWPSHDSVINYHDATETEVRFIEEALKIKLFKAHIPVSTALLKKIQQGALISPAFLPKYLKYIPSK